MLPRTCVRNRRRSMPPPLGCSTVETVPLYLRRLRRALPRPPPWQSQRCALVRPTRHVEPVELFFHAMEGVVANGLARAHGDDGLAGRAKRGAAHLAVRGLPGGAGSIRG